MGQSKFTLGGAVWINLANTIVMQDNKKADVLDDPANVRQWLEDNGLLQDMDRLALDSVRHEMVQLRGLCAEAITDMLQVGQLSDQTFSRLANKLSHLSLDVRLIRQDGTLALLYEGRNLTDRISYAVLKSLVETLGKTPADRIRKCEHEACILHFVDTSKGGKRRWCSMDLCGNRQKATEFYARQKERVRK